MSTVHEAVPAGSRPRARGVLASTAALAATLVVAAGCADPVVPSADLPEALRAPALSTDGWRRIDRPGFSFRLPPGFEDLGLHPIDSDAAVFARDGATLHYDYGPYTGRLTVPGDATEVHRDVRTRIGGRVATLVAFRQGGEWVVAARWAQLGTFGPGEVALLMTGRAPDVATRGRLLASLHSVRFP